ncbi:MAG: thioredoxin [Deltaproteobacteria bacterium]|nr:thioredoxin [Deltaproteobacteria bacterium]
MTASPTCGHCKAPLNAAPIEVDDYELGGLIEHATAPVVVDFWAPWCGPCKAVAPHLADLASEYAGRLIVAKVDTDRHQRTAATLGVRAIPTLVVYKGGKVVAQQAGALMGAQLRAYVTPWLD